MLTRGQELQARYEDAVAAEARAPLPVALGPWLAGLEDGTLAFVANRALRLEPLVQGGRKTFHRWTTRNAAVRALLHWEAEVTESREDRLAWAFLGRCMRGAFAPLADTWPAAPRVVEDDGDPPDVD